MIRRHTEPPAHQVAAHPLRSAPAADRENHRAPAATVQAARPAAAVRDRQSSSVAPPPVPRASSASRKPRPQASRSAAHPAADDIGRLAGSVRRRIIPQMRAFASHRQTKLAAEKRWKCGFCRTISPFAAKTSWTSIVEKSQAARNHSHRQTFVWRLLCYAPPVGHEGVLIN